MRDARFHACWPSRSARKVRRTADFRSIDLCPCASLAYHDYEGVAFRDDEKPRLQADLGDRNFLMLRNHGLPDRR